MKNYMKIEFPSKSCNESFARVAAAAFISILDPKTSEIAEIKTAVSEAVTNAIVHGYGEEKGIVTLTCQIDGDVVTITVNDNGKGIADIDLARTPLYTSSPETERAGMGFTLMESFMDEIEVISEEGKGTTVTMIKTIEEE